MLKNILNSLGLFRKTNRKAANPLKVGANRCLRLETLEHRRMLATLTVNVIHDMVNSSGNPLINDGDLTLRDAIVYVNGTDQPGPLDIQSNGVVHIDLTEPFGTNDTILFDQSLNDGTITLNHIGVPLNTTPFGTALGITNSVTIDATMLDAGLTINADHGPDGVPATGDGSSVFVIHMFDLVGVTQDRQVTLAGLTITGGDTFARNSHGGGIDFLASSFYNSEFSSDVTLTIRDSAISGNHAGIPDLVGNGTVATGGGLSLEANNILGGSVLIDIFDSTIDSNSTTGEDVSENGDEPIGGGGIHAILTSPVGADPNTLTLNLRNSTVSNNTATRGSGGGVFLASEEGVATFNVTNTTISGNDAPEDKGGGLFVSRFIPFNEQPNQNFVFANLDHVTITDNFAFEGGGLFSGNVSGVETTLNHTIVSGNSVAAGSNQNIAGQIELDSSYNLIGPGGVTASFLNANGGTGNLGNSSNAPGLLPLADNGGPTQTHAPLLSSPAVDAGDHLFSPPPNTDQRGFDRVTDGDGNGSEIIDIGAVESNSTLLVDTPRIVDIRLDRRTGNPATEWVQGAEVSFKDRVEAGEQFHSIPIEGANTIEIVFSKPVTFGNNGGELHLRGFNDVEIDPATITFDGVIGSTATWTLSNDLPADKYALVLDTATIFDLATSTQMLDADWLNANDHNGTPDDISDDVSNDFVAGDTMPGTMGNNFRLHFAYLPGDYDGNHRLDGEDFLLVTDPANFPVTDGNGNGVHDNGDVEIYTNNSPGQLPLFTTFGGGDFNDDEVVDTKDRLIWSENYGTSGGVIPGDFDNDGDVDGSDFFAYLAIRGDHSAWFEGEPQFGNVGTVAQFINGLAPQILDVVISGSLSTHTPFSFDTVDGSGTQLGTVPVGGADTISITFSEFVNVSGESLRLLGLGTANVPQLAEFSYDAVTMTASWRFDSWALGDHYLISVHDSVTDIEGNLLDGEWVNPHNISTTNSLVSTFPSGDGVAGGHFNFVATLLPGDANLDGVVDISDFSILGSNYGETFDQLFSDADFNGNGTVDVSDFSILLSNWGTNLQSLFILADLNGDSVVDALDEQIMLNNYGLTGATYADGDLNGDGVVDIADFDLAFEQYGLGLASVA